VGVAPCLGWGQLGSKRGDPWYGRPARYATRQTTVGSSCSYFPCHLLTSKTRQDTYCPLTPHKKTLLPHNVNALTQPQLTSPPTLPENAHQANPSRFNHQYLTLALMANMNSTMSLSNARTDANDKHQHTNNSNNDVLGGHCWGCIICMTFLTSQRCTAMSTDTHIAIARFPGQFWRCTPTWVSVWLVYHWLL